MRRCCANSISNSFLSLNFVGSMWGSMDAYNTSYSLRFRVPVSLAPRGLASMTASRQYLSCFRTHFYSILLHSLLCCNSSCLGRQSEGWLCGNVFAKWQSKYLHSVIGTVFIGRYIVVRIIIKLEESGPGDDGQEVDFR